MPDYYEKLGLTKDSNPTNSEIKKAYHRKAMKFHPDRMKGVNADKKGVAEKKFKEISEAYQVLSDLEKRQLYDQYGEDGVKLQERGGMGGMGGFSHQSNMGIPFGSFTMNGIPMFVGGGLDDFFSSMGSTGFRYNTPPTQVQIEQPLYLTLEELYTGCTKKYRVTFRQGRHKVFTIQIKPGWKAGTKINFQDEFGQVTFVVQETPHSLFKRVGNNLHWPCTITKAQSQKRLRLTLITLDKRCFSIETEPPLKEPVHRVVGEGMPCANGHGSLVITFNIV